MFRLTLITFSLGLIMIFGCNRSASTEATPPADTDVILKVPGMY